MGFDQLLNIVYQIQGAADPNHEPATLAERMQEIYDTACGVMDRTGYRPDDPEPAASTPPIP